MPLRCRLWVGPMLFCTLWLGLGMLWTPTVLQAQERRKDRSKVKAPADGDDQPEVGPAQQLLSQILQLLSAREYSTARTVLEDAAAERQFAPLKARMADDLADIKRLEKLAGKVLAGAKELQPGQKLKIGGADYTFVKFESTVENDQLVMTLGSGKEVQRPLEDLNARDWLALAEGSLTSSTEDRYVVGLFHAVDQSGDRKLAREALNKAAGEFSNAATWVNRIEQEAQRKKDELEAKKDVICGTWRVVIGEGKRQRRVNVTLRPGGSTSLAAWTWRKQENGEYKITMHRGATANIQLQPRTLEAFRGKMANGTPVQGLRQSVDKK